MRYGFATPFASSQEKLDLDFYKAVKEAGYDFLELPGTLINNISEEDFDRLTDFLGETGIQSEGLCSLFPGRIKFFSVGDSELEEYIDWIFEKAGALGVKTIGFGSGGCRRLPEGMDAAEGMDIFAGKVREHILPYLTKYDYNMVIEPFNPAETNFILTAADGAEAIRRIGSGRIGLLEDTLHMIGSEEDPVRVMKEQGGMVRHIHISEPGREMPVTQYSEKCLACVKTFAASGYDGTLSFETKCADFRDLAVALETLKANWMRQDLPCQMRSCIWKPLRKSLVN